MSDIPPQASTDAERNEPESKSAVVDLGSKVKWLGVIALLAIVGVGYVVWRKGQVQAEKALRWQQAGQAWANAQACIIGAPLDDGETLTQRLRHIQLAAAPAERGGWPASCAPHLSKLYGAIDFNGIAGDLKKGLVEKFGCDSGCQVEDPVREMQGLAAMVEDAELPRVAATVTPIARVKAKLLPQRAFVALTAPDAQVRDRLVSDDGSLHLLIADRRHGLQLCVMPADGGWGCRLLRLELTPNTVRLLRVGDDVLLRGRMNSLGKKVVVDLDGKLVNLKRGVRDGFALQHSEGDYKVALIVGGEVKHERRFPAPEKATAVEHIGDTLLWQRHPEDGEASLLVTRELLAEKQLIGAATTLGTIDVRGRLSRLCKHNDSMTVLVGTPRKPRAMLFHDGEQWLPPVNVDGAASEAPAAHPLPSAAASSAAMTALPSASPAAASPAAAASAAKAAAARRQLGDFGMLGVLGSAASGSAASGSAASATASDAIGWGTPPPAKPSRVWATKRRGRGPAAPRLPKVAFACGANDGVMTWRLPGRSQIIMQLRCTPDGGCTSKRAVLDGLSVKAWWTAATLGDNVLVVWRSEQGDLRMRFAPIEQLADAADGLIMDSAEHGGPDTRDLQAVIGRQAVVFLFGGKGMRGLRIDADGSVQPLSVQH